MGNRVAVYTQNFRFYHEVLEVLKMWSIPFVSLPSPGKIPTDVSLVLSAETDDKINARQIRRRRAIHAVREAIPYLLGKATFNELTIGIDPGPKPGIAVFGDSILLEAFESPSIVNAIDAIVDVKESYIFRQLRVNVGNGDRRNGNVILDRLARQGIMPNVVEERNTSRPHQMHNNALSAARIAQGALYSVTGKNEPKVRSRDALDSEFVTLKKVLVR